MSRRTAEASKAIRRAWDNERELVSKGKGTRNWTEDQQREILEGRCAHDENGLALEGHHMMNAEAHPELQGEPGNIQFLTRKEHLDAHKGSWRNPTCGYYDPVTGLTHPFECDAYSPCEPIDLSSPVATTNKPSEPSETIDNGPVNVEASIINQRSRACNSDCEHPIHNAPHPHAVKARKVQEAGILPQIKNAVGSSTASVIRFVKHHPVIVAIPAAIAAAVIREVVNGAYNSGGANAQIEDDLRDESDFLPSNASRAFGDTCNYPEDRSSPRKHIVRGYDRTINGHTVHVSGYTRGGKSIDD